MRIAHFGATTLLLGSLSLVAACGGSDSSNALAGSAGPSASGSGGTGGSPAGTACAELAACCVGGSLSKDASTTCLDVVGMGVDATCSAALGAYVGSGACNAIGKGGAGGSAGTSTSAGGVGGAAIGAGGASGHGVGGANGGASGHGVGGASTGGASGHIGSAGAGGGGATGGSGVGGAQTTGGSGGANQGGEAGTSPGVGGSSAGAGGVSEGIGGASTGGGGTSSNAGGFAGTSSNVGGFAGTSSSTGGTSGSAGNAGAAGCGTTLDLFIMMDQSGSMADTVAGGQTKWDAVTQAIAQYVAEPANDGISVGIQFFGQPPMGAAPATCSMDADCVVSGTDFGPCEFGICLGGSGGADSCDAKDYSSAFVEIMPLPGVGSLINQAMQSHSPSTSTPTEAALQGMIQHATAWQTAHPTHVTVGILATDGLPTECTVQDGPGLQAIAAAAFNGAPRIRTAVIGILAPSDTPTILNNIATGGGTANLCGTTNAACILDTSGQTPVSTQFQDALQAIQSIALGCD